MNLRNARLYIFEFVLGCALLSCSTIPTGPLGPTGNRSLQSTNPYLFPSDMSNWTCEEYIEHMKKVGTYDSLSKLLEKRPHRRFDPVNTANLREVSIRPLAQQSKSDQKKVHQDVWDDLIIMLSAAKAAGIELKIESAYRSPDSQNALWREHLQTHGFNPTKAAFIVAPPCYSEHATGRAVDLGLPGDDMNLADTPAYNWLKQNASKYGWIQSFPNKSDHTTWTRKRAGISVEPWHWRHKSLHLDE